MRISVSSYSFSQYMNAGKLTQLTAIEAAKKIGLDAIEFTDLNPENGQSEEEYAKDIRKEADRLGMTINAYTISANLFQPTEEACQKEVERLKKKLDIAHILGTSVMRHDACWSYGEGAYKSFNLMLPVIAKNARAVTEYGAALGIRTCTENHGFIAQDSDRMERLVEAVNHPNYGLLVDIGNFACADEDSAHAVSRVAPLAFHVHAKDFTKRSFVEGSATGYFQTRGCNWLLGQAVGEGDIPVKQCLAILKRAGYEGFLSIEYEGKGDCIEGITIGYENLKKYLSELE